MIRLLAVAALASGAILGNAPEARAQQADPLFEARQHTAQASNAASRVEAAAARAESRGARLAAEDYATAMDRALQHIDAAAARGYDVFQALNEVAQATQKHTQVLTDVLTRVPVEAQPAIERALAASQRGHDEAVGRLGQLGASRVQGGTSGGPPAGHGAAHGGPAPDDHRPHTARGGPSGGFGGGISGPFGGFGGTRGGPPGGAGGPRR